MSGEPDFAKMAADITGPCRCHEGYTSRRMVDPDCEYHDIADEIADILRKAHNAALEEAAGIVEAHASEIMDGGSGEWLVSKVRALKFPENGESHGG